MPNNRPNGGTLGAPEAHSAKERWDNIDLLRAAAILLVVLFHYTARFPADFYRAEQMPFRFTLGAYGVDLFFAVSGFCIFMTLESSKSLSNFWSKRLARLQPAYIVAILITFCVIAGAGLPGRQVTFPVALSNMLWLNAIPTWPMVDGAYWSLVVELKFYFWLGLIYYLSQGRSISLLWAGFSVVGAIVMALGTVPALAAEYGLIAPYAPAFLAGILAYEAPRLRYPTLVALGILCVLLLLVSPRFAEARWLGVSIGILAFAVLRMHWLRIPRPLTYVGLISYPLYLLHQNIGYVIIRSITLPIEIRILLAATIVLGMAALLNKTVEVRWQKPLTRLFQQAIDDAWGRLPRRKIDATGGELRRW